VCVCVGVCFCVHMCSKVRDMLKSQRNRVSGTNIYSHHIHRYKLARRTYKRWEFVNLCVDLGVHVCSSVWIRVQPPFQRPVVVTRVCLCVCGLCVCVSVCMWPVFATEGFPVLAHECIHLVDSVTFSGFIQIQCIQ